MELERLEQIVRGASSSGAFEALALMDTFGVLGPHGAKHLVETVRAMTDLTIELHPHNDFGLGTANAFAGLEAGASVIHTSMLRPRRAPRERAARGIRGRSAAHLRIRQQGRPREAQEDGRAGAELGSDRPRAEYAGDRRDIRQIESGTVASEFKRLSAAGKDLQWLFPFAPSLIGAPDITLVLGKGSGLANIEDALDRCGLNVTDDRKRELLRRTKEEAIRRHRLLTDAEFEALATSLVDSRGEVEPDRPRAAGRVAAASSTAGAELPQPTLTVRHAERLAPPVQPNVSRARPHLNPPRTSSF